MNSSKEFVKGKHNIGYVSSFFEEKFKDIEFSKREIGTYQKLPRYMNDAEIESELKPGYCDLGDVVAFMDNAPSECKDGNWNIFYIKDSPFVVDVHWYSDDGLWLVGASERYDCWYDYDRVFSPATDTSTLNTPDTVTLLSLSARLEKIERLFNKELL